MAEHLESMFGADEDRVKCPFFPRIGAGSHGYRLGRRFPTQPQTSRVLVLSHLYQRLDMMMPGVDAQDHPIDPHEAQEHFDIFYEDIFLELRKYGEIESLIVCDNLSDHLDGNVYVKFREEEHAANALQNMCGRFYAGWRISVEFSPVVDFSEATCRKYEKNSCNNAEFCNFIHPKKINSELRDQLMGLRHPGREKFYPEAGNHEDESYRDHSGWDYPHGSHEHRNDRSRSPGFYRRRRSRTPVREGSVERRAKIEQWNREREQAESNSKIENKNISQDKSLR